MAILKVVVRKDAQTSIDAIAEWYMLNLGFKAATNFVNDVQRTISTILTFPQGGKKEEFTSLRKSTLYSFPIHRKYRLVYRFTKTTLYVIAIRATMKKNQPSTN